MNLAQGKLNLDEKEVAWWVDEWFISTGRNCRCLYATEYYANTVECDIDILMQNRSCANFVYPNGWSWMLQVQRAAWNIPPVVIAAATMPVKWELQTIISIRRCDGRLHVDYYEVGFFFKAGKIGELRFSRLKWFYISKTIYKIWLAEFILFTWRTRNYIHWNV